MEKIINKEINSYNLLNFDELMEKIQPCKLFSEITIKSYFKEIFEDLVLRSEINKGEIKQIPKIIFHIFINLPLLVCEKIFLCFNANKSGYLDNTEFVEGMYELYFGSLEKIEQMTFQILDFNKEGKILIDNVILFFNLINKCNNPIDINIEDLVFEFFDNKQSMNIGEYCIKIKQTNSNVLLLFLLFLHHNLPFCHEGMNYFSSCKNTDNNKNSTNKLLNVGNKLDESTEIKSKSTNISIASKELSICLKSVFNMSVGPKRKKASTNILNYSSGIQSDKSDKIVELQEVEKKILTINKPVEIKISINYINDQRNNNENTSENSQNEETNFEGKNVQTQTQMGLLCHSKRTGSLSRSLKDQSNSKNELLLPLIKPNSIELENSFNSSSSGNSNLSSQKLLYINQDDKTTPNVKNKNLLSLDYRSNSRTRLILSNSNKLGDLNSFNIPIQSKSSSNSLDDIQGKYPEINAYKLSSDGKLLKRKLILVENDLFSFKISLNKNSNSCDILEGINSLNSYYVTFCAETIIHKQQFYPFALITKWGNTFANMKNVFFCKKKCKLEKFLEIIKKHMKIKDFNGNYEIKKSLGKGQFGSVKFGININTLEKVAIKMIKKSNLNYKEIELIRNEIEVMKYIQKNHPNILKLIDVLEDKNFVYIVMEYLECGSLQNYIVKKGRFLNSNEIIFIAKEIANGLKFLETQGVIHRDLKPDNILLTETNGNLRIKIIDFGLSKILGKNEVAKESYGTLVYSAPEVIMKKPYSNAVDVWSYGILLFYLNYGILPFDGKYLSLKEVANIICSKSLELPISPNAIFPDMNRLIVRCLEKDAGKRITIHDILEDNLFRD